MSHLTRPLLLAAAFLAVHAGPSFAQSEFTFWPSQSGVFSFFGDDCALDGRRAVFTETSTDRPFRIFERTATDWSPSAAPYVGPPVPSGDNTISVDVDGFTIVTGTAGGAVRVYELQAGAWTLKQVLADGELGNYASVAVRGDTLAAATLDAGVSVWRRVGGQWVPDVAQPLGGYGPVVVDGDRVACGGAHVYRRMNGVWGLEQSLPVLVSEAKGLALSGDTLLVGYADGTTAEAYTFDGTTWQREAVLHSGPAEDRGCRVAGDGDLAVVGLPGEQDGQGLVRVLQRHGSGALAWRLVREQAPVDVKPPNPPGLGTAVDVSGRVVLGAAPFQLHDGSGIGVGYAVELAPEPGTAVCFGDGSGAACPCANESPNSDEGCLNSSGAGMTIDGDGTSSLSADDLRLFVGNRSSIQGQFFVGRASFGAGVPFQDGLLCAAGNTRRFDQSLGSNSLGVGEDFVADEWSGTYFQAGSTYWFQYWARDTNGPCGTGAALSPAYRVTYTP